MSDLYIFRGLFITENFRVRHNFIPTADLINAPSKIYLRVS